MDGNRNGINPQQTNTFATPNPDCLSIGELGVRKRNAFAQDASLLLDRPLCGQRQKLLHLVEGCLSIHDRLRQQKPSPTTENYVVAADRAVMARRATKSRCWPRRKEP